MEVKVSCPSKVNLFLRILAREESGYHQIETLFQALTLSDEVRVREGDTGIDITIIEAEWRPFDLGDLAGLDSQDNTVVRAIEVFFDAIGRSPSVSVELTKAIPIGTGLGGGSSDAAGTLIALNHLYDCPLEHNALIELGGRLGADVPFFCTGALSAIAWGRGDHVLPRTPLPPAALALVVPRQRFTTANAYHEASGGLDLPAGSAYLRGLDSGDWKTLGALAARLGNDFERTAFERLPVLADVKAALIKEGAFVAGLTGSGSAVYGVFDSAQTAFDVANRVRPLHYSLEAELVSTLDRQFLVARTPWRRPR